MQHKYLGIDYSMLFVSLTPNQIYYLWTKFYILIAGTCYENFLLNMIKQHMHTSSMATLIYPINIFTFHRFIDTDNKGLTQQLIYPSMTNIRFLSKLTCKKMRSFLQNFHPQNFLQHNWMWSPPVNVIDKYAGYKYISAFVGSCTIA